MKVELPDYANSSESTSSKYNWFFFMLDMICSLFQKYFPEIDLTSLTVSLLPNNEAPVCYWEFKKIFLNTDTSHYSQAAYQFSHELCHYMIPGHVCSNLRWFEESVCETASYFFLRELSSEYKKLNLPFYASTGELYANHFVSYIETEMLKSTPFDIFSPQEIFILEHDCYLRNKNSYIATLLLPIFQKYPYTWFAVPNLSKIAKGQTLQHSIREWICLSPSETHPGLEEIFDLFSEKNI